MQRFGLCPSSFAISSSLKACARIGYEIGGISIHGQVHKFGFCGVVYVQTALVDFYSKLGSMGVARKVFDEMVEKNVVSWNSMLSGFLKSGDLAMAHSVFDEMPEKDVVSWNSMISGYGKEGNMEQACALFRLMPERYIASWNAMISGYGDCGKIELARSFFDAMPRRNNVSWITMISGYSKSGDVESAWEVFDQMALIDLYAKCGIVDKAYNLFQGLQKKDWVAYTAMILGCGINGRASDAIKLFQEMMDVQIYPNLEFRQCTAVGSAGNTANSVRPRKEKRLTYVLNDTDDTKHCAGINCLAVLKSSPADGCEYLFTGSRDGTLKRWALAEDGATYSATFESHVDWVNDAVIAGGNTLVSCSSDATLKIHQTWNCLSDGSCTRTLRQHSDYVTSLAAAPKNSNVVASGGLGGEVFIWDLEAAVAPTSKTSDATEDDCSNGVNGVGNSVPITSARTISSNNSISLHMTQSHGYVPIAAKGHKESVYALGMNDSGTLLVSGGTEKVVRVWDPRTGSKTMKLRGHTDNVRALLLDSTGRLVALSCIAMLIWILGFYDQFSFFNRLWDLGQQRCVHSYAVHTDSVWALASNSTFSHVYSGGRDLSLYLTDLATRESILLCTKEHPILQLALHDDGIWVATSDSSVDKWPVEVRNPQKVFQRGGSFLAGNLSFSRARASLEGSIPVPVYKEPSVTIPGTPGIVKHEILNNRRHVLTKDTAGSVKLWEITKGIVVEDYGEVSFEEKKEELFEMVSIPAWFTVDTRLGSLSVHLDTPQCFSAEMYSADLIIIGKPEDDKINLARETLKGLLAHWLTKRRQRFGSQASANGEVPSGKDISSRILTLSRVEVDGSAENDSMVYTPFEFSTASPPSIITEGSQGGPWRKKITDFDGTEDEKDFPWWCLDCVLNNRLPPRENTKCSFYLHPCEGSAVQILTQGKLSAPRILRIHKVINYVVEKMVPDKPLDNMDTDGTFAPGLPVGQLQHSTLGGDGSFRLKPWQKLKPSIEILCNNQDEVLDDPYTLNDSDHQYGFRSGPTEAQQYDPILSPDMSLATVRAYIWKKSEDLVLNYRVVQGR
ncbi:hypothetical protein HYC85_015324 [Camellia sinensis]|uniref:Uncharacterized protein n=1 Tax=Camellia sinensis TaxID=4442 RepID=A0A7J7H059_CAMSI|nr:hypothetical protein HYC85_015324 [Camellia sinensis]